MENREATHDVNTKRGEILFDIIKGRRSVRSYKDQKVSKKVVKVDLEEANGPRHRWSSIVVRAPQRLKTLDALSLGFPRGAPAAIVICSDQQDDRIVSEGCASRGKDRRGHNGCAKHAASCNFTRIGLLYRGIFFADWN